MVFFVLNPFFVETQYDMYIFGGLFSIIIIFCVYSIKHSKALLFTTIIFALLAFFGNWVTILTEYNKVYVVIDYIVSIAFLSLITFIVIKYVIEEQKITVNTLLGAVCGYLLIGLTWSFIHLLIFILDPAAYSMSAEDLKSSEVRSMNFIYYSFVTISTLGYGDIAPVSSIAKTFSWLEAVTGQIYLTVWIAQLVGLHIANKQRQP